MELFLLARNLDLRGVPRHFRFQPTQRYLIQKNGVGFSHFSSGVLHFATFIVIYFIVLVPTMSKSVKKQVEEAREHNSPDLDLSDRGISRLADIPGLCK